jgi:hypothetical protein
LKPFIRVLREPLIHFLVIGAALFVTFRLTGGAAAEPAGRIVISTAEVERLATVFSRVWMRPPTPEELRGLIENEIREEVYSREAVAMGLDRDDEIIRRRLQQKVEFLSEDVGARQEPTEAQLRAYFEKHADQFRTEDTLTFRQVYLGGGAAAEIRARDLLPRLRAAGSGADVENLGERISLAADYEAARASDVSRDFGPAFAAKVSALPAGQWEGPVESGYGQHLVLLREKARGALPPLEQVRDAVRREWSAERRQEINKSFYKALRAKYAVTVEPAWARAAAPSAEQVEVSAK